MLIIVESFFNAKRISVVDIVLVVNDETVHSRPQANIAFIINNDCLLINSSSYKLFHKVTTFFHLSILMLQYILVTARSSGILKAKQKLGVTFNSDKLGGTDYGQPERK